MTLIRIILGASLAIYIFVCNIALMSISNSISGHLLKRGISLKSDPNLIGMSNSNFWNEVGLTGLSKTDPILIGHFKTIKILIAAGVLIGVAFVVALVIR